jgi:nitronate monooxygenase
MFLREKLDLSLPLIQAPMAGVSTPALAAAVSGAGGLGSLGLGAADAAGAGQMIEQLRQLTDRPFNVNLFTHAPPKRDAEREKNWLAFLKPSFDTFDAAPPTSLRSLYKSFNEDEEMVRLVLGRAPHAVSFHFGLPAPDILSAFRERGILTFLTVTSLEEARAAQAAGIDLLVAQGIEAGGHRGIFDPDGFDSALGTMALTRLLVRSVDMPVVAAGGIMDGAGIAAALDLGAVAAQLGTAFIACPESAADEGYRSALAGPGAYATVLTDLISGRPARALANRFTELSRTPGSQRPPSYPVAYDAGKALHAAAKAKGEHGFGAHWAGQGAPLARAMPAAELVALLAAELKSCREATSGNSPRVGAPA